MCTDIHTRAHNKDAAHECAHTSTHVHTRKSLHMHVPIHPHTCTQESRFTCMCPYIHTRAHNKVVSHACAHTSTHVHTTKSLHMHVHIHPHTCTQQSGFTCMCTYIYTRAHNKDATRATHGYTQGGRGLCSEMGSSSHDSPFPGASMRGILGKNGAMTSPQMDSRLRRGGALGVEEAPPSPSSSHTSKAHRVPLHQQQQVWGLVLGL